MYFFKERTSGSNRNDRVHYSGIVGVDYIESFKEGIIGLVEDST